jgi:hypothetical protein
MFGVLNNSALLARRRLGGCPGVIAPADEDVLTNELLSELSVKHQTVIIRSPDDCQINESLGIHAFESNRARSQDMLEHWL